MAQLKINRGTTYTIDFTYLRNGVAATLVGATVRFTMKTSEYDTSTDDTTAAVLKNVTSGDSSGHATISIDPADTAELTPGKYFYDIKVEESGGDVFKVDEGTIKLDGSPTNRLS
jgi:hypothetical protein